MTLDAYDLSVSPDDVAQDAFNRLPSVSGTRTCRGCPDPQCGYCEERLELDRSQRVEMWTDRIEESDEDILEILDDAIAGGQGHEIAAAIRLALSWDSQGSCDVIRDVFNPRISKLAQLRAE